MKGRTAGVGFPSKEGKKSMHQSLKFISDCYLYCLHTIKNRMDGVGIIAGR